MNFILIAVLVLGAIALIAALVLFGVSKKFAVEEDTFFIVFLVFVSDKPR